jgi:hypothetical protein
MLPGYNTDIQYQGKTYHVQTEDNGIANPFIITLIYQKGAILARRKTAYSHLIGVADSREQIRKLMQDQHREMLKLLAEGKLETLQAPAAAPAAATAAVPAAAEPPTLDTLILKFLAEVED